MRVTSASVFCLIFFSIFLGCVPYNVNKFVSEKPLPPSLPPLQVKVDTMSFIRQYPMGYSIRYAKNRLTELKTSASKRAFDAIELVNKELSINFFDKREKIYGYAVCRATKQKTSRNYGWFAASIATLFSINLIGFPIMSQTTDYAIELEIFDQNKNSIAKYSAQNRGTAYAAMYWGYMFAGAVNIGDDIPLTKAANLTGLSMALRALKQKLQDNAAVLQKKLVRQN